MDDNKVKHYTRIKYTIAIGDIFLNLAIMLLFQFSGASVLLREWLSSGISNAPALIFLFMLVSFSIYSLATFPLSLYSSYIVEHNFGLSKEKFGSWLGDFLKSSALSFIMIVILVEVFYAFLRFHPTGWWWMSACFWIFISVVIARIFPVVIIPIFFKYKPVQDEALKGRVMDLSGRMGLSVLDVFEIDYSKKSTKANAALVGLGKSKRVVFTDTLLARYSPEEVEAVLAHEFAHNKLKHMIKLVAMSAGATIVMFYLFSKTGPVVFERFGLKLDDIAGLPIWILFSMIFQMILLPLQNYLTRNMERNADIMALKFTGNSAAFVSMLEKLGEQNMSERKPTLLAKIFFYDHPPLEERVALARAVKI
jgi:STE24 endopeptidase